MTVTMIHCHQRVIIQPVCPSGVSTSKLYQLNSCGGGMVYLINGIPQEVINIPNYIRDLTLYGKDSFTAEYGYLKNISADITNINLVYLKCACYI